jgi:hypothetical protein
MALKSVDFCFNHLIFKILSNIQKTVKMKLSKIELSSTSHSLHLEQIDNLPKTTLEIITICCKLVYHLPLSSGKLNLRLIMPKAPSQMVPQLDENAISNPPFVFFQTPLHFRLFSLLSLALK